MRNKNLHAFTLAKGGQSPLLCRDEGTQGSPRLVKDAFTLAEVLITLGIIGVVAAMSLPTLIKNYEKKVIVTRMQKFYTTFNDALRRSVAENGDMSGWTFPIDFYDATGSEEFFNTYLAKNMQYMKTESNVKTIWPTDGIMVWLNDGSAFVLSGSWVTFYPRANKTKIAGVDIFLFVINPSKNSLLADSRENLSTFNENTLNLIDVHWRSCNAKSLNAYNRLCSAYIMKNNWTFPDYYPFDELRRRKL